MTALQFINYYFVQWFGLRIARSVEAVGVDKYRTLAWGVIFVWPLTGWNSPYKPAKPKFRLLFYTTRGKEVMERDQIRKMVNEAIQRDRRVAP
jgi:hypothetical protein